MNGICKCEPPFYVFWNNICARCGLNIPSTETTASSSAQLSASADDASNSIKTASIDVMDCIMKERDELKQKALEDQSCIDKLRAMNNAYKSALKKVLGQPFAGDWDSQAIFIQRVLAQYAIPQEKK